MQRSGARQIAAASGNRLMMRISLATAVGCLLIAAASFGAEVQLRHADAAGHQLSNGRAVDESEVRRPTHIPEQPLDAALQLLATERDLQMIYSYAIVDGRHSGGASGDLTVAEALSHLLANTGLRYRYLDERTITLSIAPESAKQAGSSSDRQTFDERKGQRLVTHRQKQEQAQKMIVRDPLEEVVVTGIRASLASAIENKQNASQVVDSIVAEDIGKLPDNNVAEALQRITGVQISRSQGEGSNITIRGLSQVQMLLNGRNLFTTSGRGVALGDIPSELLAGIDVYKTSAADQIEGGLGGLVDIRLRRPFDFSGPELSATAKAFYGDISDTVDPRVSVLASNRFETGIGEFGALISAVYQQRSFGSFRNAVGTYATRTDQYDLDGDGVFPRDPSGDEIVTTTDAGTRYTVGERERVGFSTSLQLQARDNLQLYADGLYNKTDNREDNELIYIRTGTSGIRSSAAVALAPFQFAPDTNYFQYGSYADAKTTPSTYISDTEYETAQGVLGAQWHLDKVSLTGEAGYTTSKGSNQFTEIGTKTNGPLYALDLRSFIPNPALSGVGVSNPAIYEFDRYADNEGHNRGSETVARMDVDYALDAGVLSHLRSGLRYADRTSKRRGFNTSYSFTAANNLPLPSAVPGMLVITDDEVFRGEYDLAIQQWATPTIAAVRNRPATRALFGLSPNDPADTPSQFYDINERTYAAYGQALYAFTIGGIAIDGNAGMRYVRTEPTLKGFRTAQAGGFDALSVDTGYDNWLPSLNLRAQLREELYLRAAASKVVTRPSFDQLTPATTLSYLFLTGNGGNPYLKPLRAKQFDLSLEWYRSPTSIAYLAGFYKSVDGFIQNISSTQIIEGQEFLISSPQNGANGQVKGFEVGYQTFFDFLPKPFDGFGAQANYTYVDSSAPSPIPGQSVPLENLSKNSYNLIGLYEQGPLSTRLAYNWRDKYVSTTSGDAANRPLIVKAMGQLDASISYELSGALTIGLDAQNLTRNELKDYYGTPLLPKSVNAFDRTFELSLRARF
jgi:iron complex outermembrane recepter protein